MALSLPSTWSDVTARWPAVASVSSPSQAAYLADVAVEVTADGWGSDSFRAGAALAAHLALMGMRAAGGGAVVGMTLGPASISFAAPMSMAALESTAPGQEFLRLRSGRAEFRFLVL